MTIKQLHDKRYVQEFICSKCKQLKHQQGLKKVEDDTVIVGWRIECIKNCI